MVTDAEFTAAVAAMKKAGADAGKASGGWIADGNTDEKELRSLLKMWDDGDPAAPGPHSPFSGEWADGLSVWDVIGDETELDPEELSGEEIDELATAFEEAFYEAWHAEAERTVRAMLPDDE